MSREMSVAILMLLALLVTSCAPVVTTVQPTDSPPTAVPPFPTAALSPDTPVPATATSEPTSTPEPTATPEPTFTPEPTATPTPMLPSSTPTLSLAALDVNQLKDKWRTPMFALALSYGAMEGLLDVADRLEAGDVGDVDAVWEVVAIALLVEAADEALLEFGPTTDQVEFVADTRDYLSNVRDMIDVWVEDDIASSEVSTLLLANYLAVSTGMEDMLDAMLLDGLSEDDIEDLFAEFEEGFADALDELDDVTTPVQSTPSATDVPPVGHSRSRPYAPSDVASAPNVNVQVLDYVRGEQAWQMIEAANMFNDPAPEGWEYLLVMIWVKNTSEEEEERWINASDFDITGDSLIAFPSASVVEPDPALDYDLFPDGEGEGWAGYLIPQGEEQLILVVDEIANWDDDRYRYIALTEGTSIAVDPELAQIQQSGRGAKRSNPADYGETVITEDWEVTVLDVVSGDDAWEMILEANQFNDPPEEYMQYVAVFTRVRYIGAGTGGDVPENIHSSYFQSTGHLNVLYDSPWVVEPYPAMDVTLYPGAQYEGWVVVQVDCEENDLVLVFEDWADWSDDSRRYLSLEP